ncbi:hypothetical protein BGZ61DRAFT_464478 [Ilyonectria robusta]|uniref:uncharacterized protein n=1 Tax=Ilyonectria robusta TaxID=1079257 RepID=UPI001E8D22D5|nr:uncharacterized protein BGZ61DRAFT_466791 [Ilyonectria robusta]XP_046095979.1 uncharacterized protein BGZ61DRAFT_464478 [Ilyonectria robusta]KAH8656407.1 hypothetical protein BGZ61DRAFT_466791 [Ilyonectria robusta]KAH8661009.1 hypothetical protein BGZ61DRAFT_464478 [Ilyonectria robusta]
MDATICPSDLVLSCRTSENATASEIGHFPYAWDQSIPRSDNYYKKAPFYENYYGKGPAGLCFNDSALSPFQSTAVSSLESDRISSPILDAEMALNFWDVSMDIMESIPWDLSLGQPLYGGLPTLDLSQDVQTASDYTHTTAYRQISEAFSLSGKRGERESTRSLVGDDKGGTRKLPTASRKSKNSGGKNRSLASEKEDHQITFAQKHARDCHNRAEKQYRDRLNSRFTTLLNMIPITSQTDSEESGSVSTDGSVDMRSKARNDSRGVSRGEILDAARQYIQTLEREEEVLQREREQLLRRMHKIYPSK